LISLKDLLVEKKRPGVKNMHKKITFLITILLSIPLFSILVFAQNDTLRVIHLSDVHVCNLDGYHPEFVKLRKHYGDGMIPLQNFIDKIPQEMQANAVVITGDLVDYYEAETVKGNLLGTQIEQFASIYASSAIPIYLTLGNHDITTYWINDSQAKEQSQLKTNEARAAWIRNLSCFRDGTYYSRPFKVNETTYRFVFLDNGYSLGNGAYLDKPQLDWLDGLVKEFADDYVIIFMHKYFPAQDLNGDGIVFSNKQTLVLNNQTCSKGFLKILNENPNIKALFCGHGHRNVSEWMLFPSGHQVLQTETAGFAGNFKEWRLLKFTNEEIIVCAPGGQDKESVINIGSGRVEHLRDN
jgi:3',5'-cyclic AMP phosphodiesterase CpdA